MKQDIAHNTSGLKDEFDEELTQFLIELRSRAKRQFRYSLETNLPKGILKADEVVENAIVCGITAAVSARYEWAVEPVVQVAVSLLEDVNAHSEARALIECAHPEQLEA